LGASRSARRTVELLPLHDASSLADDHELIGLDVRDFFLGAIGPADRQIG
jgi:hypothetical protein